MKSDQQHKKHLKRKKAKIFVADDVHADAIALLKKYFDIIEFKDLDNRNLISNLKAFSTNNESSKDCLLIRSTRIVDSVLARKLSDLTSIRLVVTVSAGFDNIDLPQCRKYGIDVMNVAGGNSVAAAEFTFALILSSVKSVIPADYQMKIGVFNYSKYCNTELAGKTIGIIGVGNVGSKVARFAKAFGMKILGNDINRSLIKKYKFIRFVNLSKLLKNSDIITIHTPLDNSTRKLINSDNIRLIRPHVVLINTSRGGTVDEEQLIRSLRHNSLFYAGIDVFKDEPAFNKKFTKLNNVILTPHLAGKTLESKKRMSLIAAEKIIKYSFKRRNSDKLLN